MAVKSSILDKEPVNRVVNLLLEAEAAAEETPSTSNSASTSGSNKSALRIIDAFFIPKFRYDPVRKFFYEYVHIYLLSLLLFSYLVFKTFASVHIYVWGCVHVRVPRMYKWIDG